MYKVAINLQIPDRDISQRLLIRNRQEGRTSKLWQTGTVEVGFFHF